MRIRRILELSDQHLPRTGRDNPNTLDGVTAYDLGDRRHLIWVPDDPTDSAAGEVDGVPDYMVDMQWLARAHGCDYLLVDSAAPAAPGLRLWP